MSLPGAMVNANHRLDWSLGLRYSTTLATGLCMSPTWAAMVLHLATDAPAFADAYNASLAENRRLSGITDPDRPMPDLAIEGDVIEIPFWLDDLANGRRSRALVERSHLVVGDARHALPETPDKLLMFLRRNQLRVSPRALSLTMFMRLFASDLFVHGIGGGHYDQVLDAILRRYLDLIPPTFAVASATLFHPQALGRERVCPSCLARLGHRLRHDVLGDEKRLWLDRIRAAADPKAKRTLFEAMHDRRRDRLADDPRYRQFVAELAASEDQLRLDAELFDRELFYAIQPEKRLGTLLGAVGSN